MFRLTLISMLLTTLSLLMVPMSVFASTPMVIDLIPAKISFTDKGVTISSGIANGIAIAVNNSYVVGIWSEIGFKGRDKRIVVSPVYVKDISIDRTVYTSRYVYSSGAEAIQGLPIVRWITIPIAIDNHSVIISWRATGFVLARYRESSLVLLNATFMVSGRNITDVLKFIEFTPLATAFDGKTKLILVGIRIPRRIDIITNATRLQELASRTPVVADMAIVYIDRLNIAIAFSGAIVRYEKGFWRLWLGLVATRGRIVTGSCFVIVAKAPLDTIVSLANRANMGSPIRDIQTLWNLLQSPIPSTITCTTTTTIIVNLSPWEACGTTLLGIVVGIAIAFIVAKRRS